MKEKSISKSSLLYNRMVAILILAIILSAIFVVAISTSTYAEEIDADQYNEMLSRFKSIYNQIIMPTLTALGMMVFAIAGFANFLKLKSANDDGEREKAKKAILWWLIGVVGAVAVLWIVPNLIPIVQSWFGGTGGSQIR